jgi:hypothetical protein
MIVFNSDFFLQEVLESIYPFAHAICISEGCVKYWHEQGFTTSTDNTNKILSEFPDPLNKIKIVHGTYEEKTEQCRAWFNLVPEDTDYVFCVDADEIHSAENILKLITFLDKNSPNSVGFKSDTFYGGFARIIGGFEREHSFKRVLKYQKGCYYRTHRQPTLAIGDNDITGVDVNGNELYEQTGITMWHGSYVSPRMVHDKIQYYEGAVIAKGQCVPDYFHKIFLTWVLFPDARDVIEERNKGVHEFRPEIRGEAFTMPFTGVHPIVIRKKMDYFLEKIKNELRPHYGNHIASGNQIGSSESIEIHPE